MSVGCWLPQAIILSSMIYHIFSKNTIIKTGADGFGILFGLFLLYWGGFFDCLLKKLVYLLGLTM